MQLRHVGMQVFNTLQRVSNIEEWERWQCFATVNFHERFNNAEFLQFMVPMPPDKKHDSTGQSHLDRRYTGNVAYGWIA